VGDIGQKNAIRSPLFNTATDGCGANETERNIKCSIINFRHFRSLFDRKKSGLRRYTVSSHGLNRAFSTQRDKGRKGFPPLRILTLKISVGNDRFSPHFSHYYYMESLFDRIAQVILRI